MLYKWNNDLSLEFVELILKIIFSNNSGQLNIQNGKPYKRCIDKKNND